MFQSNELKNKYVNSLSLVVLSFWPTKRHNADYDAVQDFFQDSIDDWHFSD